jgi:hypothetical protein
MEVWVRRDPTGFETFDMEGVEELEEHMKGLVSFGPLEDSSEVCVEITCTWAEAKDMLSLPFFSKIWFDPKSPRLQT